MQRLVLQTFWVAFELFFTNEDEIKKRSFETTGLNADEIYHDILCEQPPEQTDLFTPNITIGDQVMFYGIRIGDNTWVCPMTGGRITIKPVNEGKNTH